VHLVFDRRICNYAIAAQAVDNRTVYLEPWQNVTIAGCTDDDYYGDPDDAPVTNDDVRYLLEGTASVFPAVTRHRVISTWVGVRPTLYDYGPIEEDLSRQHRIFSHRDAGLPGMYSIGGGKLAAYRQISEEAADRVEGHLGRRTRCTTGERPLPGSEEEVDVLLLASHFSIDPAQISRLVYRQGSNSRDILAGMLREPSRRAMVCRCEPVTDAEIRYVVRYEKARTLGDVMRRTRLGTGPCGGSRCAMRAGSILGQELGWSPEEILTECHRFVRARFEARRPALRGAQARQEVLNLDLFRE
jgi:glycerol-3-phosphate dehydrogenase